MKPQSGGPWTEKHRRVRPSSCAPLRAPIIFRLSSADPISTMPKPCNWPVCVSVNTTTRADSTIPYGAHNSINCWPVVRGGRPLTYTLRFTDYLIGRGHHIIASAVPLGQGFLSVLGSLMFLKRIGATRRKACPTPPSGAHAETLKAASSWKEGQGDLALSNVSCDGLFLT